MSEHWKLFKHIENIILVLDESGKILYANDYALNVIGHYSEDILGEDLFRTFTAAEFSLSSRDEFNKIRENEAEGPSRFQSGLLSYCGTFQMQLPLSYSQNQHLLSQK